ncbi:hypothetical protein BDN71DRAFT_1511981 [Pleurotus eryngii]|uniref:NGN domain-containing protein n=1 Tax=Pleurotus eryngii TaxID=5323 RepID=A0A9P5ZK58_PLEER|nr:hypothetical protein BDN71DRAFT_1511981 [Pleurotus eryngii]
MRPYRDILAFLDIEAGVENSDDDRDEEDFDAPGFISNDPEIDEGEIDGGVSITSPDRGDSSRLWNNDAESIVKEIMDRYRGCEGSAWKHQHATDRRTYIDGWKSTVAYLPSIADGDIWKVDVTPGRELVVVATIFNKALALGIDGVDSAFYREGIPGVVYIEACNYGAVLTILKGINNVWLQYYKAEGGLIDLVPISERLALLTLDISPVNEVEKAADEWQRFVRIRDRTRYRNQLAIIGGYVMDAREALVLVIPCAGTSRHFAAPPALKRAAPIAGDLEAVSPPFLTSDGVDNLQSVAEGQYLSGLEVQRIDVSKLVYRDIHPAAHELDLFKATQHDEICGLVRNARNLQIRQGKKFEGRYSWEDIEVPRSDLVSMGSKGCATTVKADPYSGLNGRIYEYVSEDMVIVSPDAGKEQIVDIRVSDIQRTVDPGDEVEIMMGRLKGHLGFYVSTDDEAKARIYLLSTLHGRMVSIPFSCIRTPPDTWNVRLTAQWSQSGVAPSEFPPNPWIFIVDHPLRGYEGYIVGSRLVKPIADGDDEIFEFEVNKLNHITSYTTRISAKYLQEKHSGIPIMEAIHLLPQILRQQAQAQASTIVQGTPSPIGMTPRSIDSESTWQAVAHEYTHSEMFATHDRSLHMIHWLWNPVMMHKKFQILILQTLFDDGSYRTDNAISGYTVVTEEVTPWAERIVVKMGEQALLRQRNVELSKIIPDNLALKSSERVVVIGSDMGGSTQSMGLAGLVIDCPYDLNEGVHLIAHYESPGSHAYVSGVNLCRTGGPALWKGKLYA